ncbi:MULTISPECIES: hypothetical protein [Mycolicibacterium]|uniref:hypothetical protein n=1 Tax=Mycolicibacterium TaxID=1866885 RepID=UPI0026031F9C|nr:hypothetical protein [Mycolicibacterium fortuitum]
MAAEQPSTALPPVPNPSRIDDWETSGGTTFRFFEGEQRGKAAPVRVTGFQYADGTVREPRIVIVEDEPLDVAGAEELIESLTAAIADIRRFNG